MAAPKDETKATLPPTPPPARPSPTPPTDNGTDMATPVVVATPTQQVTLPVRMTPKVDPKAAFRSGSKTSPGEVVNADPGYQYTYLASGECRSPQEAQARRQRLVDGGWEPRSGPLYTGPMTSEHVLDAPDAELWRRPRETEGFEWLRDLCESMKSELWTMLYSRGRSWLPPTVETALFIYHGLRKPPVGVPPPTYEQLVDLVWDQVKPHPGQAKQPRYPWAKEKT